MRGCWNPVGQCFFCWGGFLSGGVFLPFRLSPRAHIHTHTHSQNKLCLWPVEAQALCHLDLLGPPRLRPPQEREFSFKKERERVSSCCLWLNHESDATKPSSLYAARRFVCPKNISNCSWISRGKLAFPSVSVTTRILCVCVFCGYSDIYFDCHHLR